MSSTLRLLARQAPLTPVEWKTLAEDQMRSLIGGFAHVQLDELRNLPCLWDGAGSVQERAPFRDSPVVDGTNGLMATVRGSFFKQPPAKIVYRGAQKHPNYQVSRDGTVVLYGLTVRNEWLLVHVEFRCDPGYKNSGIHVATRMILQVSTPEEIATAAGVTPEEVAIQVWKDAARRERAAAQAALEEAMRQADSHRERLYNLHLTSGWVSAFHPERTGP